MGVAMGVAIDDYVIPAGNLNLSQLLSDWKWLINKPYQLMLLSAFGNLFLQDERGQVDLLDTNAGDVKAVAAREEDFQKRLHDKETVEEWFATDLVDALRANNMFLGERECYSFIHPPILGGKWEASNVEPTDIYVHCSIMGQIHRQVKDLPPGTRISRVNIVDDTVSGAS